MFTVWCLACGPDENLRPGGDCVVAGDADSDGERADFGVLWDAVDRLSVGRRMDSAL